MIYTPTDISPTDIPAINLDRKSVPPNNLEKANNAIPITINSIPNMYISCFLATVSTQSCLIFVLR